MARITRVKRAQQRYKMIPETIWDEFTGKNIPLTTAVKNKDGSHKTDKRGRMITRRLSVADKSQPLPMPVCDRCDKRIEVGQPYKHITPKSGPYGGRTRFRCADCPDWNVWDYSYSLSARLAQIESEASAQLTQQAFTSVDDAQEVASDVAERIRELAEEKRESAQNIEDGFGHETSSSQELNDVADQLESWADDFDSLDLPDVPEPEEQDCETCAGTGEVDEDTGEPETCSDCDGEGRVTPDEATDEQMDEWQDDVRSVIEDALSNCPV